MKKLLFFAVLGIAILSSCEAEVRDGVNYRHPRGWERRNHPEHHEDYDHGYHHDGHGNEIEYHREHMH